MALFAIADTHLSLNTNKSMHVFSGWDDYVDRLEHHWRELVTDDDTVVIAGDISWGMNLKQAQKDFAFLNSLPGKKLIFKGNHDYWWTTVASMRTFLKENDYTNIDFLYNNSYEFDNKIICGTRGWSIIDEGADEKLINRELIRLEISLQDGINKYGTDKEIIVFMHYPPITKNKMLTGEEAKFVEMMKKYNVKRCYYGHLHGASITEAIEGNIEGIEFKLVSADGLEFKLLKI